jgi:hypothetical protein
MLVSSEASALKGQAQENVEDLDVSRPTRLNTPDVQPIASAFVQVPVLRPMGRPPQAICV